MGNFKFGAGLVCTVMAFGFAGAAQADFVKTVTTESECTEYGGDVMDLNDVNHCFIALNEFKDESEEADYAGELTGVTTCAKKNIRKSKKAGDFCLIKLETIPVAVKAAPSIEDTSTGLDNSEAEMAGVKKAKESMMDVNNGN